MCKIKVRKFLLNISWRCGVMEEERRTGGGGAWIGLNCLFYESINDLCNIPKCISVIAYKVIRK